MGTGMGGVGAVVTARDETGGGVDFAADGCGWKERVSGRRKEKEEKGGGRTDEVVSPLAEFDLVDTDDLALLVDAELATGNNCKSKKVEVERILSVFAFSKRAVRKRETHG
jgi:hypothetical protein